MTNSTLVEMALFLALTALSLKTPSSMPSISWICSQHNSVEGGEKWQQEVQQNTTEQQLGGVEGSSGGFIFPALTWAPVKPGMRPMAINWPTLFSSTMEPYLQGTSGGRGGGRMWVT